MIRALWPAVKLAPGRSSRRASLRLRYLRSHARTHARFLSLPFCRKQNLKIELGTYRKGVFRKRNSALRPEATGMMRLYLVLLDANNTNEQTSTNTEKEGCSREASARV